MAGTGDALPRRGFVLQGRQRITVQILDPIAPEAFASRDPEALAAQLRAAIAGARRAQSAPAARDHSG